MLEVPNREMYLVAAREVGQEIKALRQRLRDLSKKPQDYQPEPRYALREYLNNFSHYIPSLYPIEDSRNVEPNLMYRLGALDTPYGQRVSNINPAHSPKYYGSTPRELFEDIKQAIIVSYRSTDMFLDIAVQLNNPATPFALWEKLRFVQASYLLKPFIILRANGYSRFDLTA